MRKLTYADAICEAQIEEMARDESVFVIGEDVDIDGGVYKLTRGILERFGGEYAKADQALFDDASWIGWRLAELLPLEDEQRQQLLQIDDPDERLDRLLVLLPDET